MSTFRTEREEVESLDAELAAEWSCSADQIKAARRILQLADEALEERDHWKNPAHRQELQWTAMQLEGAAILALTHSDIWGDAWAEAGFMVINSYKAQRKLIENISGPSC